MVALSVGFYAECVSLRKSKHFVIGFFFSGGSKQPHGSKVNCSHDERFVAFCGNEEFFLSQKQTLSSSLPIQPTEIQVNVFLMNVNDPSFFSERFFTLPGLLTMCLPNRILMPIFLGFEMMSVEPFSIHTGLRHYTSGKPICSSVTLRMRSMLSSLHRPVVGRLS